MLGGIVSSILGGLSSLFMEIVTPIVNIAIKLLTKYIVAPIILLVVNLVNYIISIFLYDISCFILALIDYVEVMFRLLAGLEVDGVQLNLGSSSEKGGDLVLQLIRTPEIRDVFLAMVVVGMFLLIITTIFQMIKVEYTTEGAKNAKGPILNKAFKGMANMIMLPALCVFGVFIGNQVLDLLDKATKPDTNTGQSATISGTLFVTAASDAFYREGNWEVNLYTLDLNQATTQILINSLNIIVDTIEEVWDTTFQAGADKSYIKSESERKSYESQIASGAISYWNVGEITSIYNYSKINYLLLIFGGCIVIKTLYATCFGMIVRLYQCGMLFIISPAVIGMTPINEGGLGKWRSSFIGQVLSAYGVVLALNIFFILVRVLLSINFNFTSWDSYYFGASMMEGLLKAIIVIGGTISIEKFAKEIGGYFGAADALSQGKEMQQGVKKAIQDVGNGAVKAIGSAVQVALMATGVGGAAVGGIKAAGAASKAAGGGLKGAMAASKSISGQISGKIAGKAEEGVEFLANSMGLNYNTRADKELEASRVSAERDRDDAAHHYSKVNKKYTNSTQKQSAQIEREKKNFEQAEIDYEKAKEAGDYGGMRNATDRMEKSSKEVDRLVDEKQKIADKMGLTAAKERFDDKQSKLDAVQDKVNERSTIKGEQLMTRSGASRQALKQHTLWGRALSEADKKYDGYASAAAKEGGKETTAAYEHLKKIKSDAVEEATENRYKNVITEKNTIQAGIMKKMTVEEVEVSNKKLDITANSGLSNLNALQNKLNNLDPNDRNYDAKSGAIQSQIESLTTSLAQSLGVGVGSISKDIHGNFQVTEDFHIDTKNIEAMMEKMVKNGGMNNKAVMQEAINEAIKGKTADQAKMIQEIFEKVVAKYQK